MKAILIKQVQPNTNKVIVGEVDIQNNLDDYYKHIGCDLIDMVRLEGNYIAIVDDEGLLQSGNLVFSLSNVLTGVEFNLAGNILIVADDEVNDGEVRGLQAHEIENFINGW